ncbi:protein NDR1-like [Apium graveolens]|uniref:protein NDR1-like n=1 Tax=Apium graveolens TaxID=4045 RepID=UPI003D79EDBD
MGAISGCSRCAILCFLILFINFAFCFVVGIFFSWVNVRTVKSGASFYVQKFYVPALNSTAGGNYTADNTTTSINFVFNFVNKHEHMGIYYDDLNVTFYYGRNKSLEIGSHKLYGFHQHAEENTYSGDSVEVGGVPWNTIVRNGSKVDFRVDLATKVRYSQMFFKGKRRQVRIRAIVEVNDTTGLKIKKKSIRLKSGATKTSPCRSTGTSLALSLLMILLFYN